MQRNTIVFVMFSACVIKQSCDGIGSAHRLAYSPILEFFRCRYCLLGSIGDISDTGIYTGTTLVERELTVAPRRWLWFCVNARYLTQSRSPSSEAASSRRATSRRPPRPPPPWRWPRSCPSRRPRCPRPTPTARWTGPTTPTSRATASATRYLPHNPLRTDPQNPLRTWPSEPTLRTWPSEPGT